MTNEPNRRSIRRLILEGIVTGATEGSVIYLFEHAATIANGCTWIVHRLLG